MRDEWKLQCYGCTLRTACAWQPCDLRSWVSQHCLCCDSKPFIIGASGAFAPTHTSTPKHKVNMLPLLLLPQNPTTPYFLIIYFLFLPLPLFLFFMSSLSVHSFFPCSLPPCLSLLLIYNIKKIIGVEAAEKMVICMIETRVRVLQYK